MAEQDFASAVDPYRRELVAHCYRMLGSYHDAEDAVQETLLRAWRGYDRFEHRSSVRTWLYRIATRVCLTAADSRERRVLPAGIGEPATGGTPLGAGRPEVPWLEPIPDAAIAPDPADVVATRETTRLAFVAALQDLPARQRATLLLRDVVGLSAAEVAEQLELSVPAVTSALQRARAQVDPDRQAEEIVMTGVDQTVVDKYVAAFEQADLAALAGLLRHDVQLQMPPVPTWFAGRDAVLGFFGSRRSHWPDRQWRFVVTGANGCPALGAYSRQPDGGYAPHSIQVLDTAGGEITHIYAFLEPDLFRAFALPPAL